MNSLFFSLSVLDTNDRFLRKVTIGQAHTEKGYSRQVGGLFSTGVALFLLVLVYTGPESGSLLFSFLCGQWPVGLPPSQGFVCNPSAGLREDQKVGSLLYYLILSSVILVVFLQ